jgi:hypothetical protein
MLQWSVLSVFDNPKTLSSHHIFHIFVDTREKYEQNKFSYFSLKCGGIHDLSLQYYDQSRVTEEQSWAMAYSPLSVEKSIVR